MKPWNTVIFDIDDTLYDQMVPFRKACEAVLGGKGLDAEALYSARGKRGMEALQKVTDGLWTMEQNHIYRTKAGCADLGVAISDEEALRFQQVYAKAQQQLRISPIMAQVLDICTRENWNPGIITKTILSASQSVRTAVIHKIPEFCLICGIHKILILEGVSHRGRDAEDRNDLVFVAGKEGIEGDVAVIFVKVPVCVFVEDIEHSAVTHAVTVDRQIVRGSEYIAVLFYIDTAVAAVLTVETFI